MNKYQEILLTTLAGIELNIEVLIIVLLWHFDYKIAFWILLFLAIRGTIIKLNKIKMAQR